MNETDKKITKALEHCLTVDVAGCSECPYRKGRNCINRLETDALALINRLDVELEALQRKYALAVAEREANVKGFTEALAKAKSEAAREIFDEIEKVIGEKYNNYVFGNNDLDSIEQDAIINFADALSACFAEIKRKHVTPDCRDCRFLVGCETACGGGACDMFDPEN